MTVDDLDSSQLEIEGLTLSVFNSQRDRDWYSRRETIEEINSNLYEHLRLMGVKTLVDVGANYGLVSAIGGTRLPGVYVFAIEADSRLTSLLEKNLALNGVTEFKVLNAIVGEASRERSGFSLNPHTTLDNRVSMQEWRQIEVPMVTLDSLLDDPMFCWPAFIKIVTQGYEEAVFRGGELILSSSQSWILKSEFAPFWLESQNSDPEGFLHYLISRYRVFESPQRFLYKSKNLSDQLGDPLSGADVEGFVDNVRGLNANGRGWVDLLILPKKGLLAACWASLRKGFSRY